MDSDNDLLLIDLKKTTEKILDFISKIVGTSKDSGVVIGLSGGVDSSLTAVLCVKALGKDKVLGILMPTSFTPREDIEDASELAENLGIRTKIVEIDHVYKTLITTLKVNEGDKKMRMPMANLLARIRMMVLYFYANVNNYLVAGTSDRSEALIGYFTKYGDGGADFLPICHLLKTNVRKLASFLNIPERIVLKPSSPQLYPGHKLSDELPLNYDLMDSILVGLFDQNLTPKKVFEINNVKIGDVLDIMARHKKTRHKRALPPMINRNCIL
jgi:NAD+ synthase